MNSSKLEEKILDLRPHYSDKYRAMIEAISNKGEKTGTGNIAQFGAFYQTFMYACIIGVRLGKPKYFEVQEATTLKTKLRAMQMLASSIFTRNGKRSVFHFLLQLYL